MTTTTNQPDADQPQAAASTPHADAEPGVEPTPQRGTRSDTRQVGPPPPFDAELAPALTVLRELLQVDALSLETLPQLRQAPPMPGTSDEELSREGAFVVEQRTAPGPQGAPDLALLIVRPAAATTTPVIYHIHGGGMMLGDFRFGVPQMVDLAAELGLAIVSVEYRLAPEHPHPAPVEDCYAGLLWTVEHAEELGFDRDRVVVAGGSAGGGLAAAVALLARDRGGPTLAGQLLMCPMLDDRNDSVSGWQLSGLGIWDRANNDVGWTALLGEARGTDHVSPYAAPARATELSGLPPAFVDVGSAETFRDECVDYAMRIWQAGGRAELHVWPGGFHGFDAMVPQAVLSQDALAAKLAWLRRVLA